MRKDGEWWRGKAVKEKQKQWPRKPYAYLHRNHRCLALVDVCQRAFPPLFPLFSVHPRLFCSLLSLQPHLGSIGADTPSLVNHYGVTGCLSLGLLNPVGLYIETGPQGFVSLSGPSMRESFVFPPVHHCCHLIAGDI